VIAALIEREPIRAAVAVHAPFACVNYDGPAAAWAAAVAAACGWPARSDIGYPTPGSFGSWMGLDGGLPVLTLELPPGPLSGFREAAAAALDEAVRAAPAVLR
jgi:protein MpaA